MALPDIEVVGLDDVPAYDEPAETEPTFEGNALIKARVCVAASGLPTLADDCGIASTCSTRMPGVLSARWAGPGASDEENNALLLRQLEDVAGSRADCQVRLRDGARPSGRYRTRTAG